MSRGAQSGTSKQQRPAEGSPDLLLSSSGLFLLGSETPGVTEVKVQSDGTASVVCCCIHAIGSS